jgi:CxxC-x17-CxxC domain-containing protein
MEIQDKNLTCTDCGTSFVFTGRRAAVLSGEGIRARAAALPRLPVAKKDGAPGGEAAARHGPTAARRRRRALLFLGRGGGDRQFYSATCSACGGPAKLSFQPSNDRPVFCRTCFQARQTERSYR